MANTVLVGLQWGDEGKGKIIDVLTKNADVVVRFQGGNNAGHTVEIGDNKFVLHLIPSGILRDEALCVIGNGLVVDILGLYEEIQGLEARGIRIDHRLQISSRCQLVFNYHRKLDALKELHLGSGKIGTTGRGIGPAYADKVNRVGLRGSDLCHLERMEERFRAQAAAHNVEFEQAGMEPLDIDAEWENMQPAIAKLAPMVSDTVLSVNRAIEANQNVLFEGAQGTWLDVDYGTYPFVTSSNTTVGGACTGTGVPPTKIEHVVGIAKAYTTRVGEGPFPTELFDDTGKHLAKVGHEFGATTGRPRRCGWFDAVATRYAAMLNGVTNGLVVTKLDVLDELETIKICTAYELDGERITDMPSDNDDIARVVPVYEEHPGWMQPTDNVTCWDELPELAKKYLCRMEELLNAKLEIVSVGPRRSQTFTVDR